MADDSKDPDEDLLRAVRAAPEGDLRAFEELIQLHQKRILADCQFLTRDFNNSEDLAQEVFVKAFFGVRNFEGRSTFRHWLQRIKVNHCLNHVKKRQGKESLTIDETAENLGPLQAPAVAERELEEKEQRLRIEATLHSMPATLRIPLVMRDMDELSFEEIASALGVGLSAAKMRVKRARDHFRRIYEGDEGGRPAR